MARHSRKCMSPAVKAALDEMPAETSALSVIYQRAEPLMRRADVAGTLEVLSVAERALVDVVDAEAGDLITRAERRAGARCAAPQEVRNEIAS